MVRGEHLSGNDDQPPRGRGFGAGRAGASGGRAGQGRKGGAGRSGPRTEKPLTPIGLERSAAWHLTRKAMTEAELKTALLKKVRRARLVHGEEPQAMEWVEALMERLRSSLLLDDARVAHARVESGRARGLSTRLLQQKLRRQGLTEDVVATAFSEVDAPAVGGLGQALRNDDDDDLPPDLKAACIYGRRRRLTNKDPQKALAALARQGFSFDIAKRALARLQEDEAVDDDDDDGERS